MCNLFVDIVCVVKVHYKNNTVNYALQISVVYNKSLCLLLILWRRVRSGTFPGITASIVTQTNIINHTNIASSECLLMDVCGYVTPVR